MAEQLCLFNQKEMDTLLVSTPVPTTRVFTPGFATKVEDVFDEKGKLIGRYKYFVHGMSYERF